MMSDLQNSDFISWKENIMFLDNAWTDLYQQIINHGDKTFLKEFTFNGDSIELPDDFYQLYYIAYSSDQLNRPIHRRSKTTSENGPYYDIIGNNLKIYNNMSGVGGIKVQYFPIKNGFTFAAEDMQKIADFVISNAGHIKDTWDKYILIDNGTTSTVYDIINQKLVSEENVTGHYVLNDNLALVSMNNKMLFRADGRLYSGTTAAGPHNTTILTISKVSSNTIANQVYKKVELPDSIDIPDGQINALTDSGIYWVDSEGVIQYYDFLTASQVGLYSDVKDSNICSWHNSVYYETTEGVWQDDLLIVKSDKYDKFIGVMKIDTYTGYGLLFVDQAHPTNFTIKSAFIDTEVDFPNNFYFNYLAYTLASYYKLKQGADPSSVMLMAQQAAKTFYDTLPRDENEFVRISNVYAR